MPNSINCNARPPRAATVQGIQSNMTRIFSLFCEIFTIINKGRLRVMGVLRFSFINKIKWSNSQDKSGQFQFTELVVPKRTQYNHCK